MDVVLWAFEKEEAMMINEFFAAIQTAERVEDFFSTWNAEKLDCMSLTVR